MKKIILFIGIIHFCVIVNAQVVEKVADTAAPIAEIVTVIKDDKIDVLLDKKIVIQNKSVRTQKATGGTEKVKLDKYGRINMPGFRVQVMNSTDRALVYQMKGKIYQMYPSHKQYVIAQAPFFKLRFGNFATKAEADKYRKALAPMFPAGVYVVSDIIEGKVQMKKPEVEEDKKETKKK